MKKAVQEMSQARVDKETLPPTRQDVAIEAFARGIQVGFKRGLKAAAQMGRGQDLPALLGMRAASSMTPEEITSGQVLGFLRRR